MSRSASENMPGPAGPPSGGSTTWAAAAMPGTSSHGLASAVASTPTPVDRGANGLCRLLNAATNSPKNMGPKRLNTVSKLAAPKL